MVQIVIDLRKLERGTHVGRVKVTRGGKTFYRKQRVGRKEEKGISINSIMSDMDDRIKKGQGAIIALHVGPEKFMELCKSRNISENDVNEMKKILDFHASGGERQRIGDEAIVNNLEENTSVGKVFRLLSELETLSAKKYLKSNDKDLEVAKKRYESDLKFYNEIMSDPEDAKIEAQIGLDSAEMMHHENQDIYRKGEIGKDIESWTMSARGAWQGKGRERLIPGHRMSIVDIDKSGYMIIGGFTRKVGQSGEAEVLLIRKSVIGE